MNNTLKTRTAFLLLMFFFSLVSSCKKDGLSGGDTVTYELSGGSVFSLISYYDESGTPTTISNPTSNRFSITFRSKATRPTSLVLQAFIIGSNNDNISGSIKVNGKTVKSGTENGFLQLIYVLN